MLARMPGQTVEIEHRNVDAGGLRVHLAEAGSGDPILLLHGWPQSSAMWERVMRALAPRCRLLAPDLRGFGQTEAPGHGYDGETFARDQVALLDALGIERARVIGHDWGGWTAMLLGIGYPERIERMIACATPHPWPRLSAAGLAEAWRSWYAVAIATPRIGPRLVASGWMPRRILSHGNVGTPFSDADLDRYVAGFRAPERAEATHRLYRYYQSAFRDAVRGRWRTRRIDLPTLLMLGERDRYVSPKLSPGYEAHASAIKLEIVPETGHFIVDERPELILDRALTFFDA